MRSGAAVEFALRGGVHASAMINSISTRRKLTKLVNARQTGQEQQDAALQVWKGQQPGKPKSKDDKSYEQIELHSHSLEYNAISVGCACGPCKCCKGEKYSWNIVLKHVHSIQTKVAMHVASVCSAAPHTHTPYPISLTCVRALLRPM